MLFASQLVLAYTIAKVSAVVAGDPAVAVALLCCSIKKSNI
jgi:hypothetical protein